jgi:hypothetical protein
MFGGAFVVATITTLDCRVGQPGPAWWGFMPVGLGDRFEAHS